MTKGIKYDDGKPRLDLLPPCYWPEGSIMRQLANWFYYEDVFPSIADLPNPLRVLQAGAAKYGDYNWFQGLKWSQIYAAALRHATAEPPALTEGHYTQRPIGAIDSESGLPHDEHLACCLYFLREYYEALSTRGYEIGECNCPWYTDDYTQEINTIEVRVDKPCCLYDSDLFGDIIE